MKTFVRTIIVTSLLSPFVALASEGDATIFWKTFTATPSAGITLTWSDPITYVYADAPVTGTAAVAGAPDWTSLRTISESTGGAFGSFGAAEADADLLHSHSNGSTSSALGTAWREGIFTLSGPGTVTFEVDYAVSVLGGVGNNSDFSTAAASLFLESNTPRADGLLNSSNGTDSESGRLQLVVTSDAPGPVSMKLIGGAATITTAVPEPATTGLLLGGLGLLGWTLRRKALREQPAAA